MRKKECIISYGPCVTDKAWRLRALPLLNPASTKRMLRLASAFDSSNRRCFIVAPGIMPRIKTLWRVWPSIAERFRAMPVVTSRQLAVKWLGYMLTPLTAAISLRKISRRRKIDVLVQYTFYPDSVVAGLYAKFFCGSKIVLDCEDISVPRFSDWHRDSETRPIQQIWAFFMMRLSFMVADCILVPSRKFSLAIPQKEKIVVVSGCQEVNDSATAGHGQHLRLLVNGGLAKENGTDMIIEALYELDDRQRDFSVKICGYGPLDGWVSERIKEFKNIKAEYFGTLDNSAYEQVFAEADVCFAVQRPHGRHGYYKTPSKGYEAICAGKALIVSDIGDFGELPDDVCYHLKEYTSHALAQIIGKLNREGVNRIRRNAVKYARMNFDTTVIRGRLMKRLAL